MSCNCVLLVRGFTFFSKPRGESSKINVSHKYDYYINTSSYRKVTRTIFGDSNFDIYLLDTNTTVFWVLLILCAPYSQLQHNLSKHSS
jgi:hypothetical protein